MKSGIIRTTLPGLALHVKQVLKSNGMTIRKFAELMQITPQTASRLLNHNDWKVSELLSVSDVLKINLFQFYTPELLEETNALHGDIARLKDELKKKEHEETLSKQQVEISVLREILGKNSN